MEKETRSRIRESTELEKVLKPTIRRVLWVLNKNKNFKSPVISLSHSGFLTDSADMLIDTGSDLNLLKENVIRSHIEIDRNKIFYLTGISKGLVKTKGEISLFLKGTECKFQIVPINFPIAQKGILGIEYLSTQGATLQFNDSRNINLYPYQFHIPGDKLGFTSVTSHKIKTTD